MRGPHAARSHLHARARPRDSSPPTPPRAVNPPYQLSPPNADALSCAPPQDQCTVPREGKLVHPTRPELADEERTNR